MTFKEDTIAYILGTIATVFSLISNVPQMFHNIKYKNVDGISIYFIICRIIFNIFLIAYGIHLQTIMVILVNIGSLTSTLIMLYYWFYTDNKVIDIP